MSTSDHSEAPAAKLAERVIDVHHHWLPRELVDHVEQFLPPGYRVERQSGGRLGIYDPDGLEGLTVDPERWCRAERTACRNGCRGYRRGRAVGGLLPRLVTLPAARLLNDAYADLQRQHPRRFVGLAHVPPWGDDGALAELERAHALGLRGVCITTNFQGAYPDEEAIRPLLRQAAALGLPVVVHAAGAAAENRALRPHGLYRTIGRSFDSCLVAARLLASGVLDELPTLRVVIPHLGGGFLHVGRVAGVSGEGAEAARARTRRGLEQLLFDTAPSFTWSPLEIGWAAQRLGAARLALGSDYRLAPARAS